LAHKYNAVSFDPRGILDAKTRELKSLRKESDKAKIILLSLLSSGARGASVVHSGKRGSMWEAEALLSAASRFPCESWATHRRSRERKFDERLSDDVKQGNKSFITKGRGSSVVEQPIRNRQVVGSTPTLGSKISFKTKEFSEPVTHR
jgi:hypothetical protein